MIDVTDCGLKSSYPALLRASENVFTCLYLVGATWTDWIMVAISLMEVSVRACHIHDLFSYPDTKHSREAVQRVINVFPCHAIEGVPVHYLVFVKAGFGQFPMAPESHDIARVGGHFFFAN